MKRLFRLLLLMPLLAACEQDVYDKGDSQYSYLRADMVDAKVGGDKKVVTVVTDDGEELPLTAPYSSSWIAKADTTYRAVMYYNLKGSQAEVVSMSQLSTVRIKPAFFVKDKLRDDPLSLESAWVSGNKKYLNMSVIMKIGAIGKDDELQVLGMVGDSITADGGKLTCHIRLYHSQGDVPQYYSQRYYFSVPLSGIEVDSLQLRINTYDGVVVKGFRR